MKCEVLNMFEMLKMMKTIKQKTECTKEQAKYLAKELYKLPKLKNFVMQHLDDVNLYNCDKVKLVRLLGYRDDAVNIIGLRRDNSFKTVDVYNNHNYCFDVKHNYTGYSVY